MGIFCAHQVGTEFQPDSAMKRSHNLRETYQLPSVQQITPNDGHRRCPKHVKFYDKINFGYLMHLVLYEACHHDAWSLEHKALNFLCNYKSIPHCSADGLGKLSYVWVKTAYV